ncbi:T9SS type A sorting domain-containing protein [Hymenobacter sp. BRD67]|uniref:T9SS type A sorting domain-containing protein n=1 Tax=Hymenobacter sp. BRD67 TaxID=2675877 RepID=UPI001565097D|nr:T9SS type A sorting domain-containing protein [Hymenobacter sp. BRD67]QKG53000.1 T9SS type A sorting domain-containing protein [Hymenobacter sp. BRD67]
MDAAGTATHSPVRGVVLGGSLALYPNPASGSITLAGATPGMVVRVLDALGRVVATATADSQGTARLVLPAGTAAGVYVVRGGQALRLAIE